MSDMWRKKHNFDFLKQFRNAPLFIYSASYLSGILTAGSSLSGTESAAIFASSVIIAALGIFYLNFYDPLAGRDKLLLKIQKIMFAAAFFSLGLLNIFLSGYGSKITKITSLPIGKIILLKVTVKEFSSINNESKTIIAYSPDYQEKILFYIKGGNSCFETGDTLIFSYKPTIFKSAGISQSFDINRYYRHKGIYSSGFVDSDNIEIIKAGKVDLETLFARMRDKFAAKERELLKNDISSGVIIALTTGLKTHLSKDVKKSFSKSGTIHLMAVSGLHVNFIYMILSVLTMFLGNKRLMRIIRAFIIISFVWSYALFTGLAPSILRAVIMISMAEAGRASGREGMSLNSLSFAAIAICLHNPAEIFDAGFQLSFLATLSIILFVPLLHSLYVFRNKVLRYLWNSVSVSICCQAGTMPLTLFYFGYFPTYFMFSNIIAIPLSSLLIIAVILQFSLSGTIASEETAKVVVWLSEVLIWFVEKIESLPFSSFEIR